MLATFVHLIQDVEKAAESEPLETPLQPLEQTHPPTGPISFGEKQNAASAEQLFGLDF